MILLLVACATSTAPAPVTVAPEWPAATSPFSGALAALDRDADGRFEQAEYDATRTSASPAFTDLDPDGDAAINAAELAKAVFATDPLAFDPAIVAPPPQPPSGGPSIVPVGGSGKPGSPPGSPGGPPGAPGGPPGASPGGPPHPAPGAPGGPPGPAPRGRPGAELESRYLAEAVRFEVAEIRARVPGASAPSEAEIEALGTGGLGTREAQAWLPRLEAEAIAAGLVWPAGLKPAPAADPASGGGTVGPPVPPGPSAPAR